MSAADKIVATTRRLRETRAEIDRLPPSPAKEKAIAALETVARDFAIGVRERTRK